MLLRLLHSQQKLTAADAQQQEHCQATCCQTCSGTAVHNVKVPQHQQHLIAVLVGDLCQTTLHMQRLSLWHWLGLYLPCWIDAGLPKQHAITSQARFQPGNRLSGCNCDIACKLAGQLTKLLRCCDVDICRYICYVNLYML